MRPQNQPRTGNICSQNIAWERLHFSNRFGEAHFGMIYVLLLVALRAIRAPASETGSRSRPMRTGTAEEAATALRAGTRDLPKGSRRPICRRENFSMSLGSAVSPLPHDSVLRAGK